MLEQLLFSLDVISILVFAVFFLTLGYRPPWWTRKQQTTVCVKHISDIPGPYPLPFFGTSWVHARGTFKLNKLHDYYKYLHEKYGAIVKEEALWNVPVIGVFERRDIEKVFKSSGRYPIRPPTEAIAYYRKSRPDRYVSTGLVNEQGETWQHLRTSLTSTLTSPKTITSFVPEIQAIVGDWCHLLKLQRDPENGRIMGMEELGSRFGLEATCSLVLGRRMGFLLPGGESQTAKKLAAAVHQHFLACRDTYFGLPLWKLFKTAPYARLAHSEEEIYALASELIATADESTRESAVFQSVLHADVDDREKTAAIVDFIAAGIYTLSNSLLFLLCTIGSNPQVQETLYKELNETTNTAYLKACVLETFRLYPTANCLARITEQEIELAGYRLKPGSVVVCHTGLACRDERNFKHPNEFHPERWLNEERAHTMATSTFINVPFGVGRRICPGKRFVEQVLPIVLAETVRNFVVKCDSAVELEFEFLLAPKCPVSICVLDRN